MKIEALHIYGYGKLERVELTLPDVAVLYGENEAGKSTIRSFIKSVLFGFPTRGQYRYEPKTGGAYGGALTVQTEYGRLRIERLPKTATGEVRIYAEDGTEEDESLLQALLQGVDGTLFDAVFSFDMHGLQNIHRVRKEELGNYLFSAGAVGTDILLQLEKRLDREIDRLYKPNGRKPVMNAAMIELREMRDDVQTWQKKIDTYDALQAEVREKEERLRQIEEEKARLVLLEKDAAVMQGLQPLLVEKQKYEDFLRTTAQQPFPADGIKRYEAVVAQLELVRAQLGHLQKQLEEGGNRLHEEEAILLHEGKVEALRLGKQSYEAMRQEYGRLSVEMDRVNVEQSQIRQQLGVFTNVTGSDTSLTAKSFVMETVQEAARLEEQKRQLDERFMIAKEQLEDQEEKVKHLQNGKPVSSPKQTGLIVMMVTSLLVGIFLAKTIWMLFAVAVFSFSGAILLQRRGGEQFKQETFQLQQVEKAYERIVTQFEEWETAIYNMQEKAQTIREMYALPPSFSIVQLPVAFEQIVRMQSLQQMLSQQQTRAEQIQEEIDRFEAQRKALQPIFQTDEIALMHARCQEERKRRQERLQLQQQQEQALEKQAELREQEQRLIDAQRQLFAVAQVETADAFYERGEVHQKAQDLQKQLSFLTTQMEVQAARMTTISWWERETWTVDYKEKQQQYSEQLIQCEQEERTLRERLPICKGELLYLEQGTTYATLMHTWSVKKEQLRETMKRWAAYEVARRVLQKTKQRYHEERFPHVLQIAEDYFQFVTEGQYMRLFAPTADQGCIVERADGMRFLAEELSQATAEQLYLALRLALVETFHTNVPLLIDDSFVHFDKRRTEQALALLKRVAQTRQVIFFTCHAHLLQAFGEEVILLQERTHLRG